MSRSIYSVESQRTASKTIYSCHFQRSFIGRIHIHQDCLPSAWVRTSSCETSFSWISEEENTCQRPQNI